MTGPIDKDTLQAAKIISAGTPFYDSEQLAAEYAVDAVLDLVIEFKRMVSKRDVLTQLWTLKNAGAQFDLNTALKIALSSHRLDI